MISRYEIPVKVPIFVCELDAIAGQLALAREAVDELRRDHPVSPASNIRAT